MQVANDVKIQGPALMSVLNRIATGMDVVELVSIICRVRPRSDGPTQMRTVQLLTMQCLHGVPFFLSARLLCPLGPARYPQATDTTALVKKPTVYGYCCIGQLATV